MEWHSVVDIDRLVVDFAVEARDIVAVEQRSDDIVVERLLEQRWDDSSVEFHLDVEPDNATVRKRNKVK